jgi:hypothetical protein
LAACQAPYGLDYKTIGQALAVSTGLEAPPAITLEQAQKVPYSSLGYRLGGSAEQMLVLASQQGDHLMWTSAERRTLVTKGGRIVKTGGFPWNLSDTYFHTPDIVATGLQHTLPAGPITRIADFQDIAKFGSRLVSRYVRKGPSTITILGASLPTITVQEHCHCKDFDWDFVNTFWVDRESGFVWRSKQHVHPNLAPFSVEIFRPPS